MVALVTHVVLPALFVTSGLFGLGVLGLTWRTYGGAFRRLQRELAICDDMQGATVTLVRHDVRVMGDPARAIPVLRRPVLRQPVRGAVSPVRLPARPAAA
ncbi:hypothetical protein [Novosphingobium sp.]|uniref:hypothetical protein n=1 Tax=Novosphingobium sp. TaxID=1874826 RepID=UPI00260BD5D4|nr:hypothetical protein [Novosphingobium sp.]